MAASATDVRTILQIEVVFAHMPKISPPPAGAVVPSLALQMAQEGNSNVTTPLILIALVTGGSLNCALQLGLHVLYSVGGRHPFK